MTWDSSGERPSPCTGRGVQMWEAELRLLPHSGTPRRSRVPERPWTCRGPQSQ